MEKREEEGGEGESVGEGGSECAEVEEEGDNE